MVAEVVHPQFDRIYPASGQVGQNVYIYGTDLDKVDEWQLEWMVIGSGRQKRTAANLARHESGVILPIPLDAIGEVKIQPLHPTDPSKPLNSARFAVIEITRPPIITSHTHGADAWHFVRGVHFQLDSKVSVQYANTNTNTNTGTATTIADNKEQQMTPVSLPIVYSSERIAFLCERPFSAIQITCGAKESAKYIL